MYATSQSNLPSRGIIEGQHLNHFLLNAVHIWSPSRLDGAKRPGPSCLVLPLLLLPLDVSSFFLPLYTYSWLQGPSHPLSVLKLSPTLPEGDPFVASSMLYSVPALDNTHALSTAHNPRSTKVATAQSSRRDESNHRFSQPPSPYQGSRAHKTALLHLAEFPSSGPRTPQPSASSTRQRPANVSINSRSRTPS